MRAKHDPFLLLEKLAREGLENVSITIRVDGEPTPVTDVALEQVLTEDYPDKASLSFEQAQAIKAAVAVVDLDEQDIADVVAKAQRGDEASARVYQALVLKELVKLRMIARRLVERTFNKDQKAKASIRYLMTVAQTPTHPNYNRARISVWLIRDVIRQAALRAKAEQEAKQREPEPDNESEEATAAE